MEASYPTAYNLGCGNKKWDGWINVDLHSDISDLKCDLRKLEIASDSADAVAAIHVIEHFYHWEVFDVLSEWRRILKPGGKMILELPCMDKVFSYVSECLTTKTNMIMGMTLLALYGEPRHKSVAMTHKWGWFTRPMQDMLKQVGMRDIKVMLPNYHFACRDMRLECIK